MSEGTIFKGHAVGRSVPQHTGTLQRLHPLKATRLIKIQGLWRAIQLASGQTITSHECRTELVRRVEKAGFQIASIAPDLS